MEFDIGRSWNWPVILWLAVLLPMQVAFIGWTYAQTRSREEAANQRALEETQERMSRQEEIKALFESLEDSGVLDQMREWSNPPVDHPESAGQRDRDGKEVRERTD